jgi:4-hydroxy-3-polyprenylbenzoate decarboxylase
LKLIIAITGSTGVIYGVRLLEVLKEKNIQTHLIISEWAKKCLTMETSFTIDYVKSLATSVSDEANMAASVSSGTHKIDGMIIAPCTMKTLSSIAVGYDETLISRAAGVTLKRIS